MDRVIRLCGISDELRGADSSTWFDAGMPPGIEVAVPVGRETLKHIVLWGACISAIAAATKQESAFDVRLRFQNDGLNQVYLDMDAKSIVSEIQKAVFRDEDLLQSNRFLARQIILSGGGFFGGAVDVANPWKQEDDLIRQIFDQIKRIESSSAAPARRRVGRAAASVRLSTED